MELSKVSHATGMAKYNIRFELFLPRTRGLDMDPTLVSGCHTQYVLGEHENVLEFLDRGPKDVPLEVHLHAEVLAHLSGCVVTLVGWMLRPRLFTRANVSSDREDNEVVHEGQKPHSRAQAMSAKPLLPGFRGEVHQTPRASKRLWVS